MGTGYLNTVTMSPDGSLCASGGKDGTAMLWDLNKGEHLYELDGQDNIHELTFSPNPQIPLIVSAGWDKLVKVWSLSNLTLQSDLKGHTGYLNTVTMSPDGSLCASGGKD